MYDVQHIASLKLFTYHLLYTPRATFCNSHHLFAFWSRGIFWERLLHIKQLHGYEICLTDTSFSGLQIIASRIAFWLPSKSLKTNNIEGLPGILGKQSVTRVPSAHVSSWWCPDLTCFALCNTRYTQACNHVRHLLSIQHITIICI